MTKIKLCGLSRPGDIQAANELMPDYIGFVFAPKSRRYVSLEKAAELKQMLAPQIRAAGVFADEDPQMIEELVSRRVIDMIKKKSKFLTFLFALSRMRRGRIQALRI